MRKNWLRWSSVLLRYAIGAFIVIWLVRNESLDFKTLFIIDGRTALWATILSIIPLVLSAWRVQLLLAVHNVEVPLIRCTTYNAVGIFYSTILPGGMSGDAVRAYYFWRCKHTDDCSKSALLGALVTDRIIGVMMMVAIGLIAATYASEALHFTPLYVLAAWGLFFAGIFVYAYVLTLHKHFVVPDNSPMKSLSDRLRRLASKLDMRGYPVRIMVLCFFLSSIIHICTVLVIYIFSVRLASGLGFSQIMAIAPVGLLINIIPVSPGGLGVGEKGFDMLYSLAGGQQGGNVFMNSRIFLYLPALFGALFALLSLRKKKLINE